MLYIERITRPADHSSPNLYVGEPRELLLTAIGEGADSRFFPLRLGTTGSCRNCSRTGMAVPHIGRHGEKLAALLEVGRLKGYASNDGEWGPGLRAIGVPVFNGRGEVEASLNMSFVSQMVGFDEMIENYVEPLMTAAGKISAALGFDGHLRRPG
jgi:hypothetical protein